MRYYIDEKLEMNFPEIKRYINEIHEYNKKELLDEFLKQHQRLYPENYYTDEWKEDYKDCSEINLIARCVEEHEYIFDDNDEHPYNCSVVENIMNNVPVYNRWTKEKYL